MRKKFSCLTSLFLIMTMLLSMSSCKAKQKTFPDLTYPDESTPISESTASDEGEIDLNTSVDVIEISMAVPYSQETMNRLAKLYYLKSTDSMPTEFSGANIDLDFLDNTVSLWSVNAINIPNEGVSSSVVKGWYESDSVPDVFLVNDINSVIADGNAQAIGNYISNYDMSSSGFYGNALAYCMNEYGAYGIPMYQSFMMLYGNSEFSTPDGNLPFRCTLTEFHSYLSNLDVMYNSEEVEFVPFARGYELIPYLTNGSYMLKDEFRDSTIDSIKVKEMLAQDLTFVNDLYERNLTYDADINGADPTITRCCGVWLDSSAEIIRWNDYYPNSLFYTLIPNSYDSADLTLYASVYPLCLSKKSQEKEFAANFAAFICFDVDALMLIQRLEPQIGYYPLCDSDMLWDMYCDDDKYGNVALMFRQNVDNSVYCPTVGSSFEQKVNDYCADYSYGYTTYNSEEPESSLPVFDLKDVLG